MFFYGCLIDIQPPFRSEIIQGAGRLELLDVSTKIPESR